MTRLVEGRGQRVVMHPSRSSQRVVLENHGCRGDEVVTGRGEDSWVGLEAEAWRGEAWITVVRVEVSR